MEDNQLFDYDDQPDSLIVSGEFDAFSTRKSQKIIIKTQLVGKRKITIIEGYKDGNEEECTKLGKKLKKEIATGGTIKEDKDTGKYVITLQGDVKHLVAGYLISSKKAFNDEITIIGV